MPGQVKEPCAPLYPVPFALLVSIDALVSMETEASDSMTLRRTRAVAFHAPSSNRAADSDTPSKSLDPSTLCPQPARANAQLDSEFSADATTVQKGGQEPCEANSHRAPSAQAPSASSRGRSGAHVRRVDCQLVGTSWAVTAVAVEGTGSRLTLNATSSARRAHLLPPGHTAPDPHSRCGCAVPARRKAREL